MSDVRGDDRGEVRVLRQARDRAIARILDRKEALADPHLTEGAQYALRKVVLDELNDFCVLAESVFHALRQRGEELNLLYFQQLEALLREQRGCGGD